MSTVDIDTISDEVKTAVAVWLLKHLVEHGQDPSSFRHLVYHRLKLPLASYTPLLNAGGMTVTTFLDLLGQREPHGDSLRLPLHMTDRMERAAAMAIASESGIGIAPTTLRRMYASILAASGRDTEAPPAS